MSLDAEALFSYKQDFRRLFILLCDSAGRPVWISDRARSVLHWENGSALGFPLLRQPMRCFPVLEIAGTVWLALELGDVPADGGQVLRTVERSLLRHHHRLAGAERRLSAGIRLGGARGRALRQVEAERRRIARELHGGVGQLLAAIHLQIESIEPFLPQAAMPVQEAVARIGRLAHGALEQVRAVSRRLRPPEWQAMSLPSAIRQLWELSGIPQRFRAAIRISELPSDLDPDIKALFYRAAQEAFSNLARHAKASRVTFDLAAHDGRLELTVSDDGQGFDVVQALHEPARLDSGAGLRTIRGQALALGASFQVRSAPGATVFSLEAPVSWNAGASPAPDETN